MSAPEPLACYAGVRTVVLGASGFVGRWVARRLARAGADLHLLIRDRQAALAIFERYEIEGALHQIDARALGRLGSTLGDLAPAIVFNLVGYGVDPEERSRPDERDATLLNAALPATLAEALDPVSTGWTGRRVVHAGSVFEYGRIGGDLAEHSPPRPEGLYGITKLAGTQGLAAACRRCGIPGLTARLCQLYGPGEPPGRLLPMLIAARTSGQLETMSQGTQRKDFTYVEDVAEGLLRLGATSGPPGEIVNLATGRLLSVRDFVLTAARLLPLPIDLLRFDNPAPDNELVHEPISIARLRELTEWSPGTTIDEGIRRTIAFGPD